MPNWIDNWRAAKDDDARIHPSRALLHPLWIVGLAVLVLNDHWLKPTALAVGWAGKISDFAGLLIAPVLLAAVLFVRSRRGLAACGVLVGIVFSAINLSPQAAAWWDAMVSTVFPFHTITDPTDLVALPMIPLGLMLFHPVMRRGGVTTTKRLAELSIATIGAMACIATSPRPCDDCITTPSQSSQVSILNKTNELHVLRMRNLRSEVVVDCEQVASDPNAYFMDGAFGPAETWFLQSGQEIPVDDMERNEWGEVVRGDTDRPCHATLVQTDTAPDILVFWDDSLEVKTYPFDAEIPKEIEADPQTIVLHADYSAVEDESQMHEWRFRTECESRADLCSRDILAPAAETPDGADYFWRSEHTEPLHFVRPRVEDPGLAQPPDACRTPERGEGLAWEDPPTGDWRVIGLEKHDDGCHRLQLAMEDNDEVERGWWVCAPADALEWMMPVEGEYARIGVSRINEPGDLFSGGYEGLRVDLSRRDAQGDFAGTFKTIYMLVGYGFPDEVDFGFDVQIRQSCSPIEAPCGQVALPADVEVTQYGVRLQPGESTSVGEVIPRDIFLVRAGYRPVLDWQCEEEIQTEQTLQPPREGQNTYFETVIVTE